jgi:hypothetical protein
MNYFTTAFVCFSVDYLPIILPFVPIKSKLLTASLNIPHICKDVKFDLREIDCEGEKGE